jgi:preprotein translocase subunit SecE
MATKVKETDEERGASGDEPAGAPFSISEAGSDPESGPAGTSESLEDRALARAGDEGAVEVSGSETEPETTASQLGSARYVHAAFFAAGILVAYVTGKLLTLFWNSLAEWPAAVRVVPRLLSFGEGERETFGLVAGAVIGVITIVQIYRKDHIRRWADEVAFELSKVTWPNREMVTSGTIVVVIASMIATAYVALLDKFWGFVTNLVYGA